ncbi:hypothetical protein D7W81_15740 [Corallococcus aberystwythensis]|uniref:Uncharacterized protein n=1 Tax=Corallococcus aberystwythensis TaxID=2316722 RepID=A0A3A8QC21_9BACT|nr:hypothetical protein D7W81_15740 [Corallococcus aberystwythensis]
MACGGEDKVMVQGHVTNGAGEQSQALTDGAPALGGDGTAEATTMVRISRVVAAGDLTTLKEAEVAADGSYTLELDDAGQRLIIEAVNASGATVGSALLDSTKPASGQAVRTAPPITSESSLEAEVYVQMVRDGERPDGVDTVDLRARLNAEQATAVRGQRPETAAESVEALGAAVSAAQATRLKAYARAGVVVTQGQLFNASLNAAAKLDATLDAGGAAAPAYDAFFAEVREATSEASDVQDQQAERQASVAYRIAVEARLSSGAGIAVADASVRSAAALEARAAEAAVKALLQGSSAPTPVLTQADTTTRTLRTNVSGARSASDAVTAWEAFGAQLATSGSASVMGAQLGVTTGGNQLALDSAINVGAQAGATLEATLGRVLDQSGKASATMLSEAVVSAFTTYDAAVRSGAAATLTTFGTKATTGVELLIIAEGSFRLR